MFLNLKQELVRNKVDIDEIAKVLHIHNVFVAKKVNGDMPLTFEEAEIIKRFFFPFTDLQYLFKSNYWNNQIF